MKSASHADQDCLKLTDDFYKITLIPNLEKLHYFESPEAGLQEWFGHFQDFQT